MGEPHEAARWRVDDDSRDDAPVTEPMTGKGKAPAQRRRPDTDQKKVRRELARSAEYSASDFGDTVMNKFDELQDQHSSPAKSWNLAETGDRHGGSGDAGGESVSQSMSASPSSGSGSSSTAMRKGAPFAGYDDFAACVAANQDKDDPEAYCGAIKHRTEDKKTALVSPSGLPGIEHAGDRECEACGNVAGPVLGDTGPTCARCGSYSLKKAPHKNPLSAAVAGVVGPMDSGKPCIQCAVHGMLSCRETVGKCDACGDPRTDIYSYDPYDDGDRRLSERGGKPENLCHDCLGTGHHMESAHDQEHADVDTINHLARRPVGEGGFHPVWMGSSVSKQATRLDTNVATSQGQILMKAGDQIKTPTGQALTIRNVRRHETSRDHYYIDTDAGTTLVPWTTNFTLVPDNQSQQHLPGTGTPGGNFGGMPSMDKSVENNAPNVCPACGGKGTLNRQGQSFKCSRCGYTDKNVGGGMNFSDATQMLAPTSNRKTAGVIAQRARQVLDQEEENPS